MQSHHRFRATAPNGRFSPCLRPAALLVIYTDERFLVNPHDPEWAHIAPFKWWLLVHGLPGGTDRAAG